MADGILAVDPQSLVTADAQLTADATGVREATHALEQRLLAIGNPYGKSPASSNAALEYATAMQAAFDVLGLAAWWVQYAADGVRTMHQNHAAAETANVSRVRAAGAARSGAAS